MTTTKTTHISIFVISNLFDDFLARRRDTFLSLGTGFDALRQHGHDLGIRGSFISVSVHLVQWLQSDLVSLLNMAPVKATSKSNFGLDHAIEREAELHGSEFSQTTACNSGSVTRQGFQLSSDPIQLTFDGIALLTCRQPLLEATTLLFLDMLFTTLDHSSNKRSSVHMYL